MSPHDLYDRNFRQLFANRAFLRDLLAVCLPGRWTQHLDWETLTRYRETSIAPRLRRRESDVIWRLRWTDPDADGHDTTELFVFLLLEFQQTVDRAMALRMGLYQLLLYQDLVKSGYLQHHRRLPAVLPIVVYNGKGRWSAPLRLDTLIETHPSALAHLRPVTHYVALDLNQLTESSDRERNLVAALGRLERSADYAALRRRIVSLASVLQMHDDSEGLRRDLVDYLRSVLRHTREPAQIDALIELLENQTMLRESLIQWQADDIAKGRAQGLQAGRVEGIQAGRVEGIQAGRVEGIQAGRVEGARQVLLDVLRARFGEPLDDAVLRRIAEATPAQLRRWS
ncbi:MAG: Rpn family recombination-promoting nuclease/putative transposase, partial [Acidobacteriota bacterium]